MMYIPYFSTAMAAIFTVAVFARYLKKGGMHLLLWSVGMLLYTLSTSAELVLTFTFNEWALKIWYIAGAILVAAWLGQGTVHLLFRNGKATIVLTYILMALSALAIVLVIMAPLTAAQAGYDITHPTSEQYKSILTRGGITILLTVLFNIYGTITLVGGALYSAFLFWRKQVLANRMFGNILIAAGALSPALAGTFIKAGMLDFLYLSDFLGATLMFIGFMLSTAGKE
jgi:hypothetical protein